MNMRAPYIVRMQMQRSLATVAMNIISSEEVTVTDVAVAVKGVFLLLQRGQSLNMTLLKVLSWQHINLLGGKKALW